MTYTWQDQERLYDGDRYRPGPGVYAGRGHDPAWPGRTPEPYTVMTMVVDADGRIEPVPVALSFAAESTAAHLDLIRRMLVALPGRRLTKVVGHGDQSKSWMACNEGPDGAGSWVMDKT